MIRLMVLSIAISGLLLSLPTSAWCKETKAATVAPVLTLEQAVDLAMQDNRPLKTATLEVGKAEEVTDALRTRWWPSSMASRATAGRSERLSAPA